MSRLDEDVKIGEEESQKIKKKFRLPWKARNLMRQEGKKPEYALIEYLTRNYQVQWRLEKIIGGNVVVINNRSYEINPKAAWRYGKYLWYIVREIDRLPVSNLDYNKVVKHGRCTDEDSTLIKAVLGAVQKPQMQVSKKTWIVILLLVIAAAVAFFIFM